MARLRRALRENAGYIELEIDIPDATQLSPEDREFVMVLIERIMAETDAEEAKPGDDG